jgi:hypothetical protein
MGDAGAADLGHGLYRHLGSHAQKPRCCKAGDKRHNKNQTPAEPSDRFIPYEGQPQPEATMHPTVLLIIECFKAAPADVPRIVQIIEDGARANGNA